MRICKHSHTHDTKKVFRSKQCTYCCSQCLKCLLKMFRFESNLTLQTVQKKSATEVPNSPEVRLSWWSLQTSLVASENAKTCRSKSFRILSMRDSFKSELFLMSLTMKKGIFLGQRLAFCLNNDAIGLMRFLLPDVRK